MQAVRHFFKHKCLGKLKRGARGAVHTRQSAMDAVKGVVSEVDKLY